MIFIFLDDAEQLLPTREGLGPLCAVGGIVVKSEVLKAFIADIDALCAEAGFPPREKFKYSPGKELWMHKNLISDERFAFYKKVIACAKRHEVEAFVVCEEKGYTPAIKGSESSEIDVVRMAIERVEKYCQYNKQEAMIIFDRPQGSQRDGEQFLSSCMDSILSGTDYVQNKKLLVPPLSSPSSVCRPLQVADLVVSATTAAVAGEKRFSRPIVEELKSLYHKPWDCTGGTGVKLWPKWRLTNLYHWILGDPRERKGIDTRSLPTVDYPYGIDEDHFLSVRLNGKVPKKG